MELEIAPLGREAVASLLRNDDFAATLLTPAKAVDHQRRGSYNAHVRSEGQLWIAEDNAQKTSTEDVEWHMDASGWSAQYSCLRFR